MRSQCVMPSKDIFVCCCRFDNLLDVNSSPPLLSMRLQLNYGYTNSKNYSYKLITKYWRWFQVNFVGSQLHKRDSICSHKALRSDIREYQERRIAKGQGPKSNENTAHLYWVHANDNEWTFLKTFEIYNVIILLIAIVRVLFQIMNTRLQQDVGCSLTNLRGIL